MLKMRRILFSLIGLSLMFLFVPAALAHPLGNFTINHYAGLSVSREALTLDYVLDMAEIPTLDEIKTLDANRDGKPEAIEVAKYHPQQCTELLPQLDLRLTGQPVTLTLVSSDAQFTAGAGNLYTLRLTCSFRAEMVVATSAVQIDFSDNAYADRLGWREIVVVPDGVNLQGDFTSTSLSQRLTAYPENLLSDPLDQRQVSFQLIPGPPIQTTSASPVATQTVNVPAGTRDDAFTRLITLQDLSLPAILLALVVSVVWGGLHAMTPGHGKTLVAAYLVGSRGTARHAVFLGLTTTITHTAGVFALGLVTLLASEFIVPEQLYPWLSFLSGLLVVGLGLSLTISRLREAGKLPVLGELFSRSSSPAHHPHDHEHEAMSEHIHPHAHEHGPLGEHSHHEHDHSHSGDHSHHGPGHVHQGEHLHYEHDHGDGRSHSHLPPGADGAPVTWRSLLALGISGGLLPCPSALIVLLGSIALGRIGLGLLLVLAFSLGLAGTLTGVGLLLVYARRLFERLNVGKGGLIMRLLPAASALFITLAGVGIAVQAFLQLKN